MAESRLPSLSPAASTSQTAIRSAMSRARRVAYGSEGSAPNKWPMIRQKPFCG
jgi:hypothetical protein